MNAKKISHLVLGFLLATICLWLIFRNVSLQEVKSIFSQANSLYILSALIMFFLGYACRIERWRVMLKYDNPNLVWKQCAGPLMASMAANNVLPFRAGDVLRAFGFNQRLGISAATSVSTLFVERLLDLLMVVTFLGIFLTHFGMETSRFIGIGSTFIIVGAIVILFLLIFPVFFKSSTLFIGRNITKISPKLGERILAEIYKVFEVLEHMASMRTMINLIFLSILVWIAEGFVFYLTALALPSIFYPLAAWIALPIGTLATIIPSTPGYVGTFDFFTIRAMVVIGNELAASTAFALMVHVILWLPPTIIGGLYFLMYPIKQKNKLKVIS